VAQKPAAIREKAEERRAEARRKMEERKAEKARPRQEIERKAERQKPAAKAGPRRLDEAEERRLEKKGAKKRP
jgi:hypothetical protein